MSHAPNHHNAPLALLRGVKELPLLPAVLAEVMTLDPESSEAYDRLVSLAERDPTFAVRLLKLANSAWSSPGAPITDINRSVARLGARAVSELITALTVAEVFVPHTDDQRALWLHSIQVGRATSLLLDLRRQSRWRSAGYMAGLLHDIGRFIMFRVTPEHLAAVDEHDWETPYALAQAEIEECGLTHDRIGALAARRWDLPNVIFDAIACHHHEDLSALSEGHRAVVEAGRFADGLSVFLMRGVPHSSSVRPPAFWRRIADKSCAARPGYLNPAELAPHLAELTRTSHLMAASLGLTRPEK